MENFSALVALLLKKGGALQVDADPHSLSAAIGPIIGDPKKATQLASAGRSALDAHRGATARTADHILGAETRQKNCLIPSHLSSNCPLPFPRTIDPFV